MASLKSTLSDEMVTRGFRQKRVAAMKATSSIHASASPPNSVLWWFVRPGNTVLVTEVCESLILCAITASLSVCVILYCFLLRVYQS
ncbi:hypothetical protein [Pseudoalteromonas rubra]|uniref:hypothetical protein n=1 Tax=Pseudoalteromonas rubra TaxID=43658 RepID=UPI003D349DB5